MITISFPTDRYTPDYSVVELRTNLDQWEEAPLQGTFDPVVGAWTWTLDAARYGGGFRCKLFAAGTSRRKPVFSRHASCKPYVCELSVFPTTPAANPSLTVVALATRLAKHIHRELRPGMPPLIA